MTNLFFLSSVFRAKYTFLCEITRAAYNVRVSAKSTAKENLEETKAKTKTKLAVPK